MGDQLFVPAGFAVPGGLTAGEMRLEPLGPRHNAADYAAWTASTGHIRATPGFPWGGWPHEMSLAENLSDLERHAQDFAAWVRADQAALDPVLYHAVRAWLERDWPFDSIQYAPRA
jgi:hypothetical protein